MPKITIPAVEVKSNKSDDFMADAEYSLFGTEGQKTELEIVTAAHNLMRDALNDLIRNKCSRRESEKIRTKKYFVTDPE